MWVGFGCVLGYLLIQIVDSCALLGPSLSAARPGTPSHKETLRAGCWPVGDEPGLMWKDWDGSLEGAGGLRIAEGDLLSTYLLLHLVEGLKF